MADKETFSILDLSAALKRAKERAYDSVLNPVEGTLLTLMHDIAQVGQEIATETIRLDAFLSQVLGTARQTLKQTQNLLPALKAAGVVDSGAQGLVYFIEGLHRYIHGLSLTDISQDHSLNQNINLKTPNNLETRPVSHPLYDVQFIIQGHNLNLQQIRKTINGMGQSPLVVGNSHTLKVHLHLNDPGLPLSYGNTLGSLHDVVVENMTQQMKDFAQQAQENEGVDSNLVSIIALSPGEGLNEILRSLGADIIINGHQVQDANPSTFLNALGQKESDAYLILPNSLNALTIAQEASALSSKQVEVIPSQNIPQGIAALLAYNATVNLAQNKATMQAMLESVQTLELSKAILPQTGHPPNFSQTKWTTCCSWRKLF